ncbi:hypothetical protein TrVGV298_009778 [Trichoderma virens]|nr:hypothetical protein TrVGV298_009778 [Trichoderma virens]
MFSMPQSIYQKRFALAARSTLPPLWDCITVFVLHYTSRSLLFSTAADIYQCAAGSYNRTLKQTIRRPCYTR